MYAPWLYADHHKLIGVWSWFIPEMSYYVLGGTWVVVVGWALGWLRLHVVVSEDISRFWNSNSNIGVFKSRRT